MNVTKRPGTTFGKDSPITVVCNKYIDSDNVQGLIEHILLEQGFNVISEAVAKRSVEFEGELNTTGGYSGNLSVYKQKELGSVYMLAFSYKSVAAFPTNMFSSFTGRVVDLRTGMVVTSLSFSQGDLGGLSIEDALRKMLIQL